MASTTIPEFKRNELEGLHAVKGVHDDLSRVSAGDETHVHVLWSRTGNATVIEATRSADLVLDTVRSSKV